jgi:hypothetical protein
MSESKIISIKYIEGKLEKSGIHQASSQEVKTRLAVAEMRLHNGDPTPEDLILLNAANKKVGNFAPKTQLRPRPPSK